MRSKKKNEFLAGARQEASFYIFRLKYYTYS
jgi:hypothetical protein